MGYAKQQAVRLLESCANQETWHYGLRSAPGFSRGVRGLATAVVKAIRRTHGVNDPNEWREGYAEAAALLRNGWRPGCNLTTTGEK